MEKTISEARTAEIRARYAMAGITLPPDLESGAIGTADALLSMGGLLHSLRPAADEPSNIFTLTPRAAS
ncbi:hypothetical protein [Marinibacterium profundimaris]|uniref:Uncharacterized protein n=1 Tax=Marinibacterium profundimaris TaxID=1679460 RepID=A0A225NE75_9RHOB|nr:hypothetical protein [Marinibacterium profundimaris]OWU70577.1 hypothetical protein ATO3_20175 [Marinibacterium profundimaris]